MSYQEVDPDIPKDSDIHVIPRDTDYHHQDLDTPLFMHSLDIPTPPAPDSTLFEDLPYNARQNGTHDFHMTPLLTELVGDDNTHDDNGNFALTRFNNPLGQLPQLSELVIPNTLPLQNSLLPDYLQSGLAQGNRPQQLLGNSKKKKEPQGPKTRPAFVVKIWLMVNDPENHKYIRWNADGESFQVVHREEFMKRVLPRYFKHNNFASFVRQLNMYGWHKVQDISSGLLKEDRSSEEVLQFKNPYFIRGREDLLDSIVRNKAGTQDTETSDTGLVNYQHIMSELDQIKMNQIAIIEDMRRIRKDNLTLWSESLSARERHQKQSQNLEKIMKFLAAVYGTSAGKISEVENGHFDKFNHQMPTYNNTNNTNANTSNNNINVNNKVNLSQPTPIMKPRLMLMDQAYQKSSGSESLGRTPSEASGKDSIEEIVRNNLNFDTHAAPGANIKNIYQQIMNQDSGGVSSPRHQLFPELNTPYQGSPLPQRMGTPVRDPQVDDLLGLEQNIAKQGQALLQVQDWIQALADRQQQQQAQLQQQKSQGTLPNGSSLDDFDVSEFLSNGSVPGHDVDSMENGKRHIEEVTEEETGSHKRRR